MGPLFLCKFTPMPYAGLTFQSYYNCMVVRGLIPPYAKRAPRPTSSWAWHHYQSLPRDHLWAPGLTFGMGPPHWYCIQDSALKGSQMIVRVLSTQHCQSGQQTRIYADINSAISMICQNTTWAYVEGVCLEVYMLCRYHYVGITNEKRWEKSFSKLTNHFVKIHDLNKYEDCGG